MIVGVNMGKVVVESYASGPLLVLRDQYDSLRRLADGKVFRRPRVFVIAVDEENDCVTLVPVPYEVACSTNPDHVKKIYGQIREARDCEETADYVRRQKAEGVNID